MKISIYSLLWAGVRDKAPGESIKQLMSEVTLISFVSIIKMLGKNAAESEPIKLDSIQE